MFLQNLRAKVGARLNGEGEAGFTLIELLVVMLILGILAAIAIPAFFNQKQKATDAAAKSMVRTAETAMETWSTESGGVYNAALPASAEGSYGKLFHNIEPTINAEMVGVEGEPSEKGYEIYAESEVEGQKFTITRNEDGTTTFGCEVEGTGGCPNGGNWGK